MVMVMVMVMVVVTMLCLQPLLNNGHIMQLKKASLTKNLIVFGFKIEKGRERELLT